MYFTHSMELWQQFPQLVPGLLVAGGIGPEVDMTARLEPWFERARQRLSGKSESQLPEVAAWRRVYAEMGLKPTQYRSAAEALLRRFRREENLPHLHPLIDLCNAISLAFALPVAVFDLNRVEDFLEVRHAAGTEQYLSFSGELERPLRGEIIFADGANRVHARRWTFRQSQYSAVTPETRQVLIVSEGMHETAPQDVPALVDALAAELSAAWTPPRQQAILTAMSPRLEFNRGE
jgi:DNA/RNA-binding domain of Phe-tRNA-synthetase-like protein